MFIFVVLIGAIMLEYEAHLGHINLDGSGYSESINASQD